MTHVLAQSTTALDAAAGGDICGRDVAADELPGLPDSVGTSGIGRWLHTSLTGDHHITRNSFGAGIRNSLKARQRWYQIFRGLAVEPVGHAIEPSPADLPADDAGWHDEPPSHRLAAARSNRRKRHRYSALLLPQIVDRWAQ